MVAAEAAAAGSLPLVANHSGLAEIAAGVAAEYPEPYRDLTSFATGDAADLAEKLRRLLALDARRAGRAPGGRAARGRRALELGRRRAAASRALPLTSRRGRGARLSADEQLRLGARAVRVGDRFHRRGRGGVRDPRPGDASSLTNRFEELKAAAEGTELEEHLVGELIASEVEVRTGRCDTFADVVALLPERRAQLQALADKLGVTLGATGTHPWSPWQEQRIIDTPHYRVRDELLRYVVWRNNSFGLHVHVAINGLDRAVQVSDGLRAYLPELLALSASSPFVENVNTGLHSARTQIFTRFFPRCGMPDVYGDWSTFEHYVRFLFDTGSIHDHTEMWWSVRPHLAFPTVEIRISDAQPLQEEAISLAALTYALAARVARAIDEGERAARPAEPRDRGELLARDPLGPRRRADRPAHARGAADAGRNRRADRVGAARRRGARRGGVPAVPAANAAERQIARHEEGASLEEIYAEQVRRRRLPSVAEEGELSPEELLEHIRQMKVSDLLLSTISTVAQLGYAKLDPAGRDLEQAKLAIESLRALDPVLEGSVPEEVLRDFKQVTANLQLAYAKAGDEAGARSEPR